MNTKITKKMHEIQVQMSQADVKMSELDRRLQDLSTFDPKTDEGKKAHTDARSQIKQDLQATSSAHHQLQANLEVATIEMLAGTDQDFHEDTPAEALRTAS